MNLNKYYHEQSKNLPDYITILTMRKFFIYEEIFKENPNIIINENVKINYDSNCGYGIIFKNIYNINVKGKFINTDYMNELLSMIEQTNQQLYQYIVNEVGLRDSFGNDNNAVLKFIENTTSDFLFNQKVITKENKEDMYAILFNNLSPVKNNRIFIEQLINNNFSSPKIDLYGHQISLLPNNLNETFNPVYKEHGATIKKDFYINTLKKFFIGCLIESQNLLNNSKVFINISQKNISFIIRNNSDYSDYFSEDNITYISKSNKLKSFSQQNVNNIQDIFTKKLVDFILFNIFHTTFDYDFKEQFRNEVCIYAEKGIINSNITKNNLNSSGEQIKKRI